jgi:rhodanese-related sulfurtransferase
VDGTQNSILADDLYARLGTASAPVVLDVRSGARGADDRVIVSAVQCDADDKGLSLDHLPTGRPIVVYCADGGKISQAAAAALKKQIFRELT